MISISCLPLKLFLFFFLFYTPVLLSQLQYLSIYLSIYSPLLDDQPLSRPLPTHTTTQTQNKCKQISMSRVGFEPTIPAFKGPKTVHFLDRAVTVIGIKWSIRKINFSLANALFWPIYEFKHRYFRVNTEKSLGWLTSFACLQCFVCIHNRNGK
jgi:hypothetical protein